MRIEYDRGTCIGMYVCDQRWAKFERDRERGKVKLVGSAEREAGVYVRAVPEGEEAEAEDAARGCPVDAITLYDEDGEQLVP